MTNVKTKYKCKLSTRASHGQIIDDVGIQVEHRLMHTALSDAITQIRFSSMTAEEFAEIHSKYKRFFTNKESIEIFFMIGKLKGFKSKRFNQTPRIPSSIKPLD